MNKKAFTLIELLVVVLIIGVLSAIALPQYTRSVEKSRAAEALILVRSIADANQRYYMANGQYTWDLDDLDIEISGENSTYGNMSRKQSKNFQYGARATSKTDTTGVIAIGNRLPTDSYYSLRIFSNKPGVYCRGYVAKGEEICKALSGTSTKVDSTYYMIK